MFATRSCRADDRAPVPSRTRICRLNPRITASTNPLSAESRLATRRRGMIGDGARLGALGTHTPLHSRPTELFGSSIPPHSSRLLCKLLLVHDSSQLRVRRLVSGCLCAPLRSTAGRIDIQVFDGHVTRPSARLALGKPPQHAPKLVFGGSATPSTRFTPSRSHLPGLSADRSASLVPFSLDMLDSLTPFQVLQEAHAVS